MTGYSLDDGVELLPAGLRQGNNDEPHARLVRLRAERWATLYQRHRHLVRSILASWLGYSADIEGIEQEVLNRAFELLASNDAQLSEDDSSIRARLAAIALNVAQRETPGGTAPRAKRAPRVVASPAVAPDPVGYQLLQRAQNLLNKMPPRLRIPWLLRHLERMSHEEIAASTGTSVATVQLRLEEANVRFLELAERDPVLGEHLEQGGES